MRDPGVRIPCLIRASRDLQHPLPRRKSGDLPTLSHLSHASRPRAPSSSPPLPPAPPGRSTEAPSRIERSKTEREKEREREKQRDGAVRRRGSDKVLEILAFTFGVD